MFTEYTNTFLIFIRDLFINSSEDISEFLVNKSNTIICKSEWNNAECLSELGEKWQKFEFPPSLSIQGMNFLLLHASSFHLIYRAIKEGKALIGAQFPIQSESIQIFVLVAQISNMQLISTALKDITNSTIEMGQKMSGIDVVGSDEVILHISLPEIIQILQIFIEATKNMHFVCKYTDKGNKILLQFTYKRSEQEIYSDEVYRQLQN